MNIDAAQFDQIVQASFNGAPPDTALSPAEAELIVAIAQLAMAADRVDDPDERALFDTLASQVYGCAKLASSPASLAPLEDEDQRLDHLRSHAAQLVGKPSAQLAYAVAYVLTIADLDLAPEEGELIESLREALEIDEDRSDELIATVGAIITPPA